jgi:dihydrofolate reductase
MIRTVAKLIYSAIASLDGYVADENGDFSWAAPDEELHAYLNDLVRPIGTFLYGRRMYEVMRFWETEDADGDDSPVTRDFAAIWRAADKVVYSRTLEAAPTARTRLERSFDPREVEAMKEAVEGDLGVGGGELAGQAVAAGLVDELHLFVVPVLVGGGRRFLPEGARMELEPVGMRRFASGTVHLHHRRAS